MSYFQLLLNICCIAIVLKTVCFCTFWRVKLLIVGQKFIKFFLYFCIYFVEKYSTISFRKTLITQEWLLLQSYPTPRWIAFLMLYWLVYNINSQFNKLILVGSATVHAISFILAPAIQPFKLKQSKFSLTFFANWFYWTLALIYTSLHGKHISLRCVFIDVLSKVLLMAISLFLSICCHM